MIQVDDDLERIASIVTVLQAVGWLARLMFKQIKKLYNKLRKHGKHEKKP